ncbi:copper resistance protein CopC [Janibacter limosus]|uniref:copper resistance CopC family protein n=1 Tax=Janibacter limosus TaxID=53458 RepID=UPI0035D5AB35|nr:copper resistance protein CopC [Janibacter limosus]
MTTTHRTPAPFVRLASAILTLAALLVAMVVTASPASAHARLEASSPKDGSTLTATPPEVMLQFNEQIKEGLNQISVKSGSTDATEGKPEVDGNTVYQPLKSSLAAGDYTVSYKVVSADGHPISGTLSFTYTPPAGDEGAVDTPTSATSSSSAPATSGSSAAPSASSPGSATSSAPGSTTAPPSSSSSAPASSATSATDGETQPTAPASTSSSSSSAAAPTDGDESSGNDGGLPTWVWIAGLGVLLVLAAAAGLIARGRGRGSNDEDIDLDEWRG